MAVKNYEKIKRIKEQVKNCIKIYSNVFLSKSDISKNIEEKSTGCYYVSLCLNELIKNKEIKKIDKNRYGASYIILQKEKSIREERKIEEKKKTYEELKQTKICPRCKQKTLKEKDLKRDFIECKYFDNEYSEYLYCSFCAQDYYKKNEVIQLNINFLKKKKINKHRNKKIIINNITFDSKKEGSRYLELLFQKEQGIIKDFKIQPVYILQDKFKRFDKLKNKEITVRAIKYIADFEVIGNNGEVWIEDVKAFDKKKGNIIKTDVFKIKEKMFYKRFPDIEFRIMT